MAKPHRLPGLAGRATRGVITAANEITREIPLEPGEIALKTGE